MYTFYFFWGPTGTSAVVYIQYVVDLKRMHCGREMRAKLGSLSSDSGDNAFNLLFFLPTISHFGD